MEKGMLNLINYIHKKGEIKGKLMSVDILLHSNIGQILKGININCCTKSLFIISLLVYDAIYVNHLIFSEKNDINQ